MTDVPFQSNSSEFIANSISSLAKLAETFDERSRLLAVDSVNPEPSKALDDITKLISQMFDVPYTYVSIMQDNQMRFVSSNNDAMNNMCFPREGSLCETVLSCPCPELVVIEDASKDPRFYDKGPVKQGMKFYAGAPLVSSTGDRYGSLCILDTKPRQFPASFYSILTNCAEMVVRLIEMEKRQEVQALAAKQGRVMLRTMSVFDFPYLLVDTNTWEIALGNKAWPKFLGLADNPNSNPEIVRALGDLQGKQLWSIFEPPPQGIQELQRGLQQALKRQEPLRTTVRVGTRVFSAVFRHASADMLRDSVAIGIPSAATLQADDNCRQSGEFTSTSPINATPAPAIELPYWLLVPEAFTAPSSGTGATSLPPVQYDLTKPAELAELEIGPLLGAGAYGRVYRGRFFGSPVAVKVVELPEGALNDAALLEACLSRSLSHPNVISTYEWKVVNSSHTSDHEHGVDVNGGGGDGVVPGGTTENDTDTDTQNGGGGIKTPSPTVPVPVSPFTPHVPPPPPPPNSTTNGTDNKNKSAAGKQQLWIVLEYCNRGSLYDAITRGWLRIDKKPDGPPDIKAIVATAVEIASVLSYLHSKDIVHGDLSGNNVLLRGAGKDSRRFSAVVCDFGLSRILDKATESAKQSLGTITHLPPEMLTDALLTKASDTYAFGVLLAEMLNGCRAWKGLSPSQVVHAVVNGTAQLDLPESTPPELVKIVEGCRRHNPKERLIMSNVLKELLAMQSELFRQSSVGGSSSSSRNVSKNLGGMASFESLSI